MKTLVEFEAKIRRLGITSVSLRYGDRMWWAFCRRGIAFGATMEIALDALVEILEKTSESVMIAN